MVRFRFDEPNKSEDYPRQISFKIEGEEAEKIYSFLESLSREKRVPRSSVIKSMLTYAMEAYEES